MLRRIVATVLVAAAVVAAARAFWVDLSDPATLQRYLSYMDEMGVLGYTCLSLVYLVLAMTPVPLMPLTALGAL